VHITVLQPMCQTGVHMVYVVW